MKVYTRKGDTGDTQLLSVGRVPKGHPRLQAYGDIDELNSVIGFVAAVPMQAPLPAWLLDIQNQLFVLGSEIAVPHPEEINMPIPQIQAQQIEALEARIDELEAELPRLTQFILPGGGEAGARLHMARTVCRRAERNLQLLAAAETVRAEAQAYLNRLSDLLFVMARYENARNAVPEQPWESGR